MKKVGLILMISFLLGIMYSCKQPETKKAPIEENYKVEVKVNDLEPDDSFYKAEKAYIDQDFLTSAKEIMNGVHFMQELLPSDAPDQKKELQNSIDELTDFAEQVKGDRINGFSDFQYFFARAGKALGDHHLNMTATIAGEGKNYKEAARHLIKSIHFLRYYYANSGMQLTKEEQAQLSNYKEFAEKIIKDQKVENIDKTFAEASKNLNTQFIPPGE